jgi:hypothetical protein
MKFTPFLIFLFLCSGNNIIGQSNHADHDHHHHPKNELGLGNYLVYLAGEKELSYGLHVHYLRTIEDSKFGVGLGFEQIFDEHDHQTLGIIGSYRPIYPLVISISPGILFQGGERSTVNFALHAEAVYEFEINNFHLGPAMGIGYASSETHISFGLHFAYGF